MGKTIGLVVTDLRESRLGLRARAAERCGGQTILSLTVQRLARVPQLDEIVLVHPAEQAPLPLLHGVAISKPLSAVPIATGWQDKISPMRRVARQWGRDSWRGGLGGTTCYDELLPAEPLLAAMRQAGAAAALLVGGDWAWVDPALCQGVLKLHLQYPDAMGMVFNQSPPGLSGLALGQPILEELAKNPISGFADFLRYDPQRPQQDPIGRDVCVQIPPAIRDCWRRWIIDTPASAAMSAWLAGRLGARLADAPAEELVDLLAQADPPTQESWSPLPLEITLELTPRRLVTGPIVPQHHLPLDRPDMPLDLALKIVSQLADLSASTSGGTSGGASGGGGIMLWLGGLGDALLYEGWEQVVRATKAAGVSAAIETDLLVERAVLGTILDEQVDVVSVRMNADTAQTYQKVMASERFKEVWDNLEWLFNERNRRAKENLSRAAVPWLLPRLIKTPDTLGDMEMFFDRWMHFTGHAVIEPATCGRGSRGHLMPPQSPVNMTPPKRRSCRQVARRMTILSDGRVALCDQDWLGDGAIGNAHATPLRDIWQQAADSVRRLHRTHAWDQLPLCTNCSEWHRP
ncbi:MAG: SPASM domain-containing protein [Phycisphaeraceae bacterium]|nr:SPASM domain-containing protein [Phycisphaeraceae bacterium]